MHVGTILKLAVLSGALAGSATVAAQTFVGSSGSYYHAEATNPCPTAYWCYVRFAQLPVDKYTTIRRVHCAIRRGVPVRSAILGTHAGADDTIFARRVTLRAYHVSTTDVHNYVVSEEVEFLIAPGRYVSFLVDTSTPDGGFITCQLIGELSNGPPPFRY